MFAVTKQSGQCFTAADVCLTPVPGGPPVPVPYPNAAMPMLGAPATTKVLICGLPALTRASRIPLSQGDEPGVQGGVVSGTVAGELVFLTSSQKVRFEGQPAVRLGDSTKHNGGNAVGAVLAPSQTKVLIGS